MDKVLNGFIRCEIRQGMYRLPHVAMIANKLLTERLAKNRYRPYELTPSLWKHDTIPVTFLLTFKNFDMKYVGKEHVKHIVHVLQQY